jgi:hypothetical protein
VNLSARFHADMPVSELVATIHRLEKKIRAAHPKVKHIYINAGSLGKK